MIKEVVKKHLMDLGWCSWFDTDCLEWAKWRVRVFGDFVIFWRFSGPGLFEFSLADPNLYKKIDEMMKSIILGEPTVDK